MALVFAVLLFSFLIVIHELGHFVAAKLSGVQVNECSLFMGPALYKKQIGTTLYTIRCIPFGGYCAMEGEDVDTESSQSFQKAAWWKRMLLPVAGSAMNFLTGLLIMVIVFYSATAFIVPTISSFEEGSYLAGEGKLQVGDRFLEIDGEKIYVQSDFSTIMMLHDGEVHDVVVERNGQKVYLNDFEMKKREFENSDGTTSLRYGFSFGIEEANFGSKLRYAWLSTIDTIRMTRMSLQMLFTGKAGLKDMSGPVGIVDQMNQVAQQSPTWVDALINILYFGGFIAINLAVMNLLPIPALDGGRVVALLLTTGIEAVTHKKIDPKYEGYIHAAGMILLLLLMAVILFKDIFTIFTR